MTERPNDEQAENQAHTAGAESVEGAEQSTASYGKFKDAEALLSAYNSLQAEFTKRCQRLKELEAAARNTDKQSPVEGAEDTPDRVKQGVTPEEREEILKEYLKDVIGQKTGAIIMSGGMGLKTPSSRPKTVEEAGNMFRGSLGK